jgi:hypothetical protein
VVVPRLVGGALPQRNPREFAQAEARHAFWWDGTRWWFRGVLAATLLQAYWQFRSLWF